MTVQMDNSSDQSSRERVQRLFNKNVELDNKRRKAAQARIPSDPNIWQQIRENYEAIILEDHAFSEQHEIEYALWQLQYRRIEELRAHFNAALASAGSTGSQNGKGPARGGPDRITKIRTQIKTFLSEATGFYHDLMLKIRAKYGLQLGYFSDDPESQISLSKDGAKSAEVKKGLISCHRCLIYLGDLARYKGLYGEGDSKARDFAAASSYYMQASSLLPSSGNPHHQLAILASYSGDELVAIYRYFRSLAVDTPFPTARDNLIIAFEKNRQSYSQLLGEAKTSTAKVKSTRMTGKGRGKSETRLPAKDNRGEVTVNERAPSVSEVYKAFSTRFVRLNGILFTRTSLETFTEVLSTAKNDLLEVLSTGPDEEYNFGSDAADCRLAIVRLIAILIFTVHNVNKETESQSYAEILQRSVLLQSAFTAIFDFMGHILERCTQLTNPSVSYLLPGIMVFVEWLACHQDIAVGSELEEKQASARLYFWNHCITFLNKLIASGSTFLEKDEDETCFFNMSRYEEGETANRLALSEDFELRGFLPLVPAQLILDFSRKHSFGSDGGSKEKKARIQRIIAAGKALANVVRVGEEGIYFDAKLKKFIIGSEPPISDDYPFTNSLEVPELSSMVQGNPVASQMSLGTLQPKPQLYMEGEEEDEVIVFKPSMTDKHVDGLASNLTSSAFLASGANAAKVNLGNVGPVSAEFDGFLVQNASSTSLMLPTSVATSNVEYLQPINSSSSKWLVEQAPVVDGLANLNVMENGLAMKSESQNHSGVTQPAAFSVPFPHSLNLGLGSNYSVQVPENVVPSKFDSVISSGAGADSLSLKQSSWVSAGLKKNPGIRPLRHFGPPPGFGSVPPKFVDESSSAMTLKNENPSIRPMDDYRWLDDYQLPASNPSNGLNNSLSSSVQSYHTVSKGNSSTGMLSFPFPGKQMSTMQVQMENLKGWQDYQLSEQLKLHQEQQKQLQRGNQQSVALPEQYGGQSLWEGRFFV